MNTAFDVAVVGGGINGCGIAADAAMRGLSVILLEQHDLASKTSSNSSKLIHGGLRYLEHCDFNLVRKALLERQILLTIAPHLVQPIPFVIPYQRSLRPAWLIRLGLFLYDHLNSHNTLPHSNSITARSDALYFSPLQSSLEKGFLYYDCQTDDARLTIVNAIQAHQYGAQICPQTEVVGCEILPDRWQLKIVKNNTQKEETISARVVVNATGPWVEAINKRLQIHCTQQLSLVKGSHIVVKKLYEGQHAYLLQHLDKRVIFAIPYHNYTMIGTTDVAYDDLTQEPRMTHQECEYLLKALQLYFKKKLQPSHVLHSWSGVRPLLFTNNAHLQNISRDYAFQYAQDPLPHITIYGGKITTYRKLAQEVIDTLSAQFPNLAKSNTQNCPLPGGEGFDQEFISKTIKQYPWVKEPLMHRLLTAYGTRTELILEGSKKLQDLGQHFGLDLYQKEVDYLIKQEWATCAEDILWRRSKLGLEFTPLKMDALKAYMS